MDLLDRVSYWSEKTKLVPSEIIIRTMKKKWGQCTVGGQITLSEDLAETSDAFQDFVIVHELLHLRVKNHGALFKAFMSVYLPGWQRIAGLDEVERRR